MCANLCFYVFFLWSHLCFVVPHTDAAVVKTSQHPWFCWVKIHTLHTVRPGCQPPFNVQPQRLRNKNAIWVALYGNVTLYTRTALCYSMAKPIMSDGKTCVTVSMLTWILKHLNRPDIPTFTCAMKLKTRQEITLHTTANICENLCSRS